MLDKPSQKFLARLQPRELLEKAGSQVVGICWREVGEASVLRVAPDTLVGVQLGSVGRELCGDDSAVFAEEVPNDKGSLVDVAPVPDDRHRPAQVTKEQSKELDDVLSADVSIVWQELEVESKSLSYRTQRDRAYRGDSISAIPAALNWRLAAWRVGPSREGSEHEA